MSNTYYADSDKQIVVDYCKNFIKHNSYIRVGFAVDKAVIGKQFDGDGHRRAFINSVSAMLVNTGQYIREKCEQVSGDYDILLNPSYYLNQSIISTNKVTRVIAYVAVIISFITLLSGILKSNKIKVSELKQTNIQLQNQEQALRMMQQTLLKFEHFLDSLSKK